jgi:hypothetical protein
MPVPQKICFNLVKPIVDGAKVKIEEWVPGLQRSVCTVSAAAPYP